MKTVKIPDRLWKTFLTFLDIAHFKIRSDYPITELSPDEIKVLVRIEKLLRKEGQI